MTDFVLQRAARDVARSLDGIAAAIDRHTESREEIAANSIANLTDEKLERLERVVMALLKLQEKE